MNNPTRTITTEGADGVELTAEFASLHSVELTQNAKGEWRVAAVKIYDNDPLQAGIRAVEAATSATADLKRAIDAGLL